MFEDTGLTGLDLDQDPQYALKNQIWNFDEADIQKACACAQGKDDKTVTIAIISRQIIRKFQARENTAYHPGLNIAPFDYPSIN